MLLQFEFNFRHHRRLPLLSEGLCSTRGKKAWRFHGSFCFWSQFDESVSDIIYGQNLFTVIHKI
jgi:hypothetical protein